MNAPKLELLYANAALDRFQRAAEKCLREVVEHLQSDEFRSRKSWLTNSEAMDYLGLSRPTLARYRATGKLPYSKVGSNIYYRVQDVEAMLESNLVRNGTTANGEGAG